MSTQGDESAAHDGALSQTEREMLESRRQAQRRARMFGRPAQDPAAPASTSNGIGDGTEGVQTSAPTNATNEGFEDIIGNVIPFHKLPRGPAAVFADLKTEPLGAGLSEPDEPAEDDDDDGNWLPEHCEPAGDDDRGQAPEPEDDIAAAPAQNQSALEAGVAAPQAPRTRNSRAASR